MSDVMVASPYANDTEDRQLSIALPSYVVSALENRGLSSIDDPVRVDLYYDGVLVAWRVKDGGDSRRLAEHGRVVGHRRVRAADSG